MVFRSSPERKGYDCSQQVVGRHHQRFAQDHRHLLRRGQGGLQPERRLATRAEILAAHRRAHVPGIPPKIDSDPELRAFIIARIATMKFTEIEAEVRANFPPDRHTSKSALSRWWIREGQFLPPQPQDKG